jgi:hypothetical protein
MPRGYNIIDEAQLQGRLWSPAQMQTALWLDASDISTISVDSGVSVWRDKSGNARHATQSTAASRPLLTTAGGYPVVRFDGTDDWLTIASSFFPAGAPSGVSFIIAAVVTENNGGFGGVITTNVGTGGTSGCGLMIKSNRTYEAFPGIATSTSTGASRSIVSTVAAAGASQIFLNGSSQGNSTYSSNVINDATSTVLGRYRTGDVNFGAFDLEKLVVVVGTSLSTIRQQLEGYMAHSLSLAVRLPATHPYANRPPLIGDN